MPNTKYLVTQERAKSYIFLPKWRNFIKLVTLAATDSTDVQVFQGLGVICSWRAFLNCSLVIEAWWSLQLSRNHLVMGSRLIRKCDSSLVFKKC